jgi:hypothetical protein
MKTLEQLSESLDLLAGLLAEHETRDARRAREIGRWLNRQEDRLGRLEKRGEKKALVKS